MLSNLFSIVLSIPRILKSDDPYIILIYLIESLLVIGYSGLLIYCRVKQKEAKFSLISLMAVLVLFRALMPILDLNGRRCNDYTQLRRIFFLVY